MVKYLNLMMTTVKISKISLYYFAVLWKIRLLGLKGFGLDKNVLGYSAKRS